MKTIAECVNLIEFRYGTHMNNKPWVLMIDQIDKAINRGEEASITNWLNQVIVDIADDISWKYGQVGAAIKSNKHLKLEKKAGEFTLEHLKQIYKQKGLNYSGT